MNKGEIVIIFHLTLIRKVEHLMQLDDIVLKYETQVNSEVPTHSQGLSDKQVTSRTNEYGENKLKPLKRTAWYLKLIECITGVFNVLLIVAGLATLSLYWFNPIEYFNNVQYI
jgi:magnesium-transporting ATPase (P-type)